MPRTPSGQSTDARAASLGRPPCKAQHGPREDWKLVLPSLVGVPTLFTLVEFAPRHRPDFTPEEVGRTARVRVEIAKRGGRSIQRCLPVIPPIDPFLDSENRAFEREPSHAPSHIPASRRPPSPSHLSPRGGRGYGESMTPAIGGTTIEETTVEGREARPPSASSPRESVTRIFKVRQR